MLEVQSKHYVDALTPTGATKAEYIGQFFMTVTEFDQDGEEHQRRISIPWVVIKQVMAAIRARAEKSANEVAVHLDKPSPPESPPSVLEYIADRYAHDFEHIEQMLSEVLGLPRDRMFKTLAANRDSYWPHLVPHWEGIKHSIDRPAMIKEIIAAVNDSEGI